MRVSWVHRATLSSVEVKNFVAPARAGVLQFASIWKNNS
ncbi:hypothetical protein [Alloactinosynnema sp. L-07]|nr:hypothetical protein [Alloactinosynnema sp. L-07]